MHSLACVGMLCVCLCVCAMLSISQQSRCKTVQLARLSSATVLATLQIQTHIYDNQWYVFFSSTTDWMPLFQECYVICIVFPNVCICQYFIPFCCWIVFHGMGNSVCLTVHGSKDIWVVFLFLLLWIKLLWIFVYRFLHEQRFSLLRDYCSWMKLLLCMVNVFMYGKSVFMSDCTTLC